MNFRVILELAWFFNVGGWIVCLEVVFFSVFSVMDIVRRELKSEVIIVGVYIEYIFIVYRFYFVMF